MKEHFRNYQILVNEKPLPFFHSVEAISDKHIEESINRCIEEQKEVGTIKENDDVIFVFKYCNT